VAGEASGDRIGARLMRALSGRAAEGARRLRFRGVGGAQMQQPLVAGERTPGLVSLFPMAELSVMGLIELLPRLPALYARLHQTIDDIVDSRPACVVCVDSKGFSQRVMRGVRARLGPRAPPLVQYVAPSVWAYRDGERGARAFKGVADHLLLLLPFECAHWAAWRIRSWATPRSRITSSWTRRPRLLCCASVSAQAQRGWVLCSG